MHEILIHKLYDHDELQSLLNNHLEHNVDAVLMFWEESTSIFIEKLTNITIEDVMLKIQDILGDVTLELDPDDE